MAGQIADLGNTNGMIYVMKPDGTSFIYNLPNTPQNARMVKLMAIQAAAPSSNKIAFGSVQFTAVDPGNVTGINVNGVNQISDNIDTASQTIAQVATSAASSVNGFTPGSGIDYTAVADNDTVFLYGTKDSGSDVNGDVVAMVTDDATNVTSTDTDMAGGHKSDQVFDEANGYRFFLNTLTTAAEGSTSGATEITNDLIESKTNSITSLIVSNGTINPTRTGSETFIEIDTEGAAATDDLTDIVLGGFGEGDLLTIVGASSSKVTTLKDTGNLTNQAGDHDTGNYSVWITYQLWKKGGAASDTFEWFEQKRSPQSLTAVATARTGGQPWTSKEGINTIALGTSGATTIKANTNNKWVRLTGTKTLTGNLSIALSTTDAVGGDIFIIENRSLITESASTFTVAGIALTTQQALTGGQFFFCYYDGAAWQSVILFGQNSGQNRGKIENADIAANALLVASLEANMGLTQVSRPISLETSEVGDMNIEMNFKGTVTKIVYLVDKIIEATDDASVNAKDNSGSSMGSTTITKSAAIGASFTISPSSNNTFVVGDVLTLASAKVTKGGKVTAFIHCTRT